MLFMYNYIIYLLLILIITIITLCKAILIFDLAYLHVNIQLLLCVSHLNSGNDLAGQIKHFFQSYL